MFCIDITTLQAWRTCWLRCNGHPWRNAGSNRDWLCCTKCIIVRWQSTYLIICNLLPGFLDTPNWHTTFLVHLWTASSYLSSTNGFWLEHVAITCGDCTISGCLQSTAWKTDIGHGCLLVLHNCALCWLLCSQLLALTLSTLAPALLIQTSFFTVWH